MTKYRDLLSEKLDHDAGWVVGCGLDRVERPISNHEIEMALQFYRGNKEKIDRFPIGARRQAVQEFVESGGAIPKYIADEHI